MYKYVATHAGRSTYTCLAPIHPETSRTFVSDDMSRFTSPAMESSGAGGQLDVTFDSSPGLGPDLFVWVCLLLTQTSFKIVDHFASMPVPEGKELMMSQGASLRDSDSS